MVDIRMSAISSDNYFGIPFWAARDLGFFEEEGLNVRLSAIESIVDAVDAVRAGELDLCLSIAEDVVIDRENGGHLEIVGGGINRLPFSLIARPGIRAFADLRGTRIGVSSLSSGSSLLLKKILSLHGLEYPRDYVLDAVGPIPARWTLLQSGEIDVGMQGAPYNFMAIDAGYSNLGSLRDYYPWFAFGTLNADSRWAESHADELVRFMRACVKAYRWLRGNRKASSSIASRETQISQAYAERAWDECVHEDIFPSDGEANLDAVQAVIDLSAQMRGVTNPLAASDIVNHTYIEAAKRTIEGAGAVGDVR